MRLVLKAREGLVKKRGRDKLGRKNTVWIDPNKDKKKNEVNKKKKKINPVLISESNKPLILKDKKDIEREHANRILTPTILSKDKSIKRSINFKEDEEGNLTLSGNHNRIETAIARWLHPKDYESISRYMREPYGKHDARKVADDIEILESIVKSNKTDKPIVLRRCVFMDKEIIEDSKKFHKKLKNHRIGKSISEKGFLSTSKLSFDDLLLNNLKSGNNIDNVLLMELEVDGRIGYLDIDKSVRHNRPKFEEVLLEAYTTCKLKKVNTHKFGNNTYRVNTYKVSKSVDIRGLISLLHTE